MPPRSITLIEAPTNLGLKPPASGVAPGVAAMPERLRTFGLCRPAGCPGNRSGCLLRFTDPEPEPPTNVRNAAAHCRL